MTPERLGRLRRVLDQRQPDLCVVTDFVNKQRNLSAIVRNCDAVGIQYLHAVIGEEDYTAFRGTAMGSHDWVTINHYRQPADAFAVLRQDGSQLVAAHLDADAVDYRSIDYTRPTAIVFGAERRGVSEEALAEVDHCVTIPMMGMVASYNVSVAAGIILAEAQRQRQQAGSYASPRLGERAYQRLFFEWGHPQVRDFCRQRGLAYPPLNDEGEIDDPSGWYAQVREGVAPLEGQ